MQANFFKESAKKINLPVDTGGRHCYNNQCRRGVAQFGSALPWGGRGRGFKSRRSDHYEWSRFCRILQGLFLML